MEMKQFIKTKLFGQLFIDQVLFESYIPIIFTCKDESDNIFICVCCQNNSDGNRWLIGKTNPKTIIKLLKDEISLRQMLQSLCSERIMVFYKNGKFHEDTSEAVWSDDSLFLPKNDSFLYADPGEFDEEILYFQSLLNLSYSNDYYTTITNKLSSISINYSALFKSISVFADTLGDVSVPSELINTLEIIGKLRIDSSTKGSDYLGIQRTNSVYEDKTIECTNDDGKISIDIKTSNSIQLPDAA